MTDTWFRADCKNCGKVNYPSRKAARHAARQLRRRKVRPGSLHAYRCPVRPDVFHLGHLSIRVRRGDMSAADYYDRTDPEATT